MFSRQLAACALAVAVPWAAGLTLDARAQDNRGDGLHAMGAIPAPEAVIRSFPTTPTYRAFLPDKVDLSSHFPKPRDQGDQGSCVGWAVGYAARAYYSQAVERKSLRDRANIPSPAYIFNSIRIDRPNCEGGSSIYKALNLLKNGSLSLKAFPYSDKSCPRPSSQQEANATGFRIADWRYVNHENLDQVKGELAQGNPVIISMKTRKGFHRLRGNRVYDKDNTESTGFHAITVTGYDERKQAFRLINSWGTRWGDKGYAWMSYDAFRRDARGAYSIRVDAPPPEPQPVVFVPVPQPKPQPGPQPEPGPAPEPHVDPVQPVNVTGLECGHVQIVSRDGKMIAKGFVGSSKDMQRLEAQLAQQKVANEVELRPWPQCEVLLTLDEELASAQRPEILFTQKEDDLQRDKLLVFDIRTPAFPSYLHIAYIQADGSVVHLHQSDETSLQTLAPGTKIHLGDGTNGSPKFRIAPPYGREMMVAIASKSPLFAKPRPQNETEREFLTALRQAILASPDGSQKRLITANYQALKTGAGVLEP